MHLSKNFCGQRDRTPISSAKKIVMILSWYRICLCPLMNTIHSHTKVFSQTFAARPLRNQRANRREMIHSKINNGCFLHSSRWETSQWRISPQGVTVTV